MPGVAVSVFFAPSARSTVTICEDTVLISSGRCAPQVDSTGVS